jgi:D-sedoheptulose 7-phosphate isomerase
MSNISNRARAILAESQAVLRALAAQAELLEAIARRIVASFEAGGKLLLCGNGGSAADAQHVAGELVGRFQLERTAWPAIALSTNTSIVTALGNDYGYEHVFSRQVEALAAPGDLVVGISTSGSSPNILRALRAATARGCGTLGFTGATGGELRALVDLCLCVPSRSTPRIQEAHILSWHIICELVEASLVERASSAELRGCRASDHVGLV